MSVILFIELKLTTELYLFRGLFAIHMLFFNILWTTAAFEFQMILTFPIKSNDKRVIQGRSSCNNLFENKRQNSGKNVWKKVRVSSKIEWDQKFLTSVFE